MADADVAITAGSGTKIDTRTVGAGTDEHRQVVVLGDPSTAAQVAGVAAGGLAVNGGALTTTSGAIAAAGTGTVGPLTVSNAGNVTFTVKNTVAASAWAGAPVLVFEQSDDNTSWGPLPVVRSETGQPGTTFTLGPGLTQGELNFDAAVEGVSYVRCRVTTGPTTNGLTVVISAGGMPFPQGNTLLAVPTDGHKPTYLGVPNSGTLPVPHISLLAPFLEISTSTAATTLVRILRVRLELTLATAAMLNVQLWKRSLASTGGTAAAIPAMSAFDSADPLAAGLVKLYTAAPTTAGSQLATIGARRVWAGLATAAGAPGVLDFQFGAQRPGKAVVLRPGQSLSAVWSVVPGSAVALTFEVEWTEEPA